MELTVVTMARPGNFTEYRPASATFSELLDVNENNMAVGGYSTASGYQPFMCNITDCENSYTFLGVPEPGTTSAAVGIDTLGRVVGSYWGGSVAGTHGYLYDPSNTATPYTLLNYPGAVLTEALGINDSGQVVGYFEDAYSATQHGYIYDIITQGFTVIDIPASYGDGTRIYDISNNGLLVGGYFDANGDHYGFTATVVPLPPALLLFGSGLAGLFGMTRLRRTRLA